MKNRIFTSLFLFTVIIGAYSQNTKKQGLNGAHYKELYTKMIAEIEYLDAEGIAVRNRKKSVDWETYKNYHAGQFENVRSASDFKEKYTAFGKGFVSGHSYFDFTYPLEEPEKEGQISSIKIGYTYPEIGFFDLASKKIITKINGESVQNIFNYFENYQTAANTTLGSQRGFKRSFEAGTLKIKGQRPETIKFEDESENLVSYSIDTNKESTFDKYSKGIDLEGHDDWRLIAKGYKVALLQKEKVALIKIKNFIYFKGRGGNISCDSIANDSTMCADVTKLRKGLKKIKDQVDYLVFDMQENNGGSENSPFLKAFSPTEFYDLRVQYKKTHLLNNDGLRPYLFYRNESAENWFQEIQKNGLYKETDEGSFLPARADFCRGASNCALVPIQPTDDLTADFKKIVVLVSETTASSADDFAFRMKEYGGALIVGQPQAADLTYALATVLFYLDEDDTIQKMYIGNNQRKYEVPGTEILKFSIPYSKTVDKKGKMLQGNQLPLDLEVPLSMENFENRHMDVLKKAVEFLAGK